MWHLSTNVEHPLKLSVDLQINPELEPVLAVLGPNGAGKSTFLRALAGFVGHTSGSLSGPPWKRPVTLVPQSGSLFPHRTVRSQVDWVYGASTWAEDPELQGWIDLLSAEAWLDRKPGLLSGGEQQRATLLRALAARPQILALDESLSQIDAPSRERLIDHLRRWANKVPERLLILTTHQFQDVAHTTSRLIVLQHGTVLRDATPAVVAEDPRDWAVASLVGYVAYFEENHRSYAMRPSDLSWEPPGRPILARVEQETDQAVMLALPTLCGRTLFHLEKSQPLSTTCTPGNTLTVFVSSVQVANREEASYDE